MPNPMNALLGAAEGVFDAGQRAMLDRAELLRVRSLQDARSMVLGAVRVGVPLGFAAFGWVLVSVSAALALSAWVHPALATLVVGAPHLAIGLAAAQHAWRHPVPPARRDLPEVDRCSAA